MSDYIRTRMEAGSWIRKMFDESAELKARHGEDEVFDLSLGNPLLEPPAPFFDCLRRLSDQRGRGDHRYMSNAGYPEIRRRVAEHLAAKKIFPTSADRVVMTVGAGGAINIVLRTILDPGDEVILLAPYFVEYTYYVENYGGIPRIVQTDDRFNLDLAAIESAITSKTKAILINSPNNPTGRVYSAERVKGLLSILADKSRKAGRAIYLLSDEPYRPIVYDGARLPDLLGTYPDSFFIFSWSKALSIPGDRIGFVAVHEGMNDMRIAPGLVFANRILGFVNAPATLQHAVADLLDLEVDVGHYQVRRDLLYRGLSEAGFEVVKPEGAFYMFPRTPIADDVRFCREALAQRVLVVPGSGFGRPGHVRMAYCTTEASIRGAVEGLARLFKRLKP